MRTRMGYCRGCCTGCRDCYAATGAAAWTAAVAARATRAATWTAAGAARATGAAAWTAAAGAARATGAALVARAADYIEMCGEKLLAILSEASAPEPLKRRANQNSSHATSNIRHKQTGLLTADQST